MFGKNLKLNPLESRKRLLLAESELNRAQTLRDWQQLTDEAHRFAHHAGNLASFAAAAAVLVAGVKALVRKKSAPAGEKPSWLRTMFNGASLMATLWPAFRSSTRD